MRAWTESEAALIARSRQSVRFWRWANRFALKLFIVAIITAAWQYQQASRRQLLVDAKDAAAAAARAESAVQAEDYITALAWAAEAVRVAPESDPNRALHITRAVNIAAQAPWVVGRLGNGSERIESLSPSPDGRWIYAAAANQRWLWERAEDWGTVRLYKHWDQAGPPPRFARLANGGRWLLSSADIRAPWQLWDLESGVVVEGFNGGEEAPFWDEERILVAGRYPSVKSIVSPRCLWSAGPCVPPERYPVVPDAIRELLDADGLVTASIQLWTQGASVVTRLGDRFRILPLDLAAGTARAPAIPIPDTRGIWYVDDVFGWITPGGFIVAQRATVDTAVTQIPGSGAVEAVRFRQDGKGLLFSRRSGVAWWEPEGNRTVWQLGETDDWYPVVAVGGDALAWAESVPGADAKLWTIRVRLPDGKIIDRGTFAGTIDDLSISADGSELTALMHEDWRQLEVVLSGTRPNAKQIERTADEYLICSDLQYALAVTLTSFSVVRLGSDHADTSTVFPTDRQAALASCSADPGEKWTPFVPARVTLDGGWPKLDRFFWTGDGMISGTIERTTVYSTREGRHISSAVYLRAADDLSISPPIPFAGEVIGAAILGDDLLVVTDNGSLYRRRIRFDSAGEWLARAGDLVAMHVSDGQARPRDGDAAAVRDGLLTEILDGAKDGDPAACAVLHHWRGLGIVPKAVPGCP